MQKRRVSLWTLVLLVIGSLALHVWTISTLFQVRSTASQQLSQLQTALDEARREPLVYQVPINQTVPIKLDVPINQSLNIPINTSVKIKDTIDLPVDTGFGSLTIPVPIDVTIPVSTNVPISFNQTVAISTSVAVDLNVPITIDLNQAPFNGYLDRLQKALADVAEQLK
ncbi:hypothetical protein [Herpetosiphon sp. NSE202]|uniref:hypothetical protein n=1 Tax=Herpetosiphon sp. NSE202 TaxID=3351349 RepID=UPI00362D0134